MEKIILASASPRRKQFFDDLFGKNYIVHPGNFEEMDSSLLPVELAEANALGKARDVAACYDSGIVVAADSVVVLGKKILGKPKDAKDAYRMLKMLSGRLTKVITGLAVIDIGNKKELIEHEITKVKMNRMIDREIISYIETGDPLDKAGAYGIQSKGAVFVESIDGCYSNVVGLPLPRLMKIFRKLGIEVFK